MNQKKYPKFWWRTSWMEYELNLPEMEKRLFSYAITLYGVWGKYDGCLSGESLSYFEKEVKPDLDRQHQRMDKGLEP